MRINCNTVRFVSGHDPKNNEKVFISVKDAAITRVKFVINNPEPYTFPLKRSKNIICFIATLKIYLVTFNITFSLKLYA